MDKSAVQRKFFKVFQTFRIMILLYTFLGVSMNVRDLHVIAHDLSHELCDHDHGHDHSEHDDHPCDDPCDHPCDDPHHHHQCACLQPVLGLPEFPHVKLSNAMLTRSWQRPDGHWLMPEDPTYTVDIPPVIA